MTVAEKRFPMPAPGSTVRVALAADVFVAPCELEIAPTGRVFVRFPCWTEVTLTVTLQLAPLAMVAPVREKREPLDVALTVPSEQVVEAEGGAATSIPAGKLSASDTPRSVVA